MGKREDGSFYDRFRNRLMFPIHNESGKIIGFGGRALAAERRTEVFEFAGNADIQKELRALQPAPRQGGDSQERTA